MDFRAAMNFAKYDDDEPRDDRGRWKGTTSYKLGTEDHTAGLTKNPFTGQPGREAHAQAWDAGAKAAVTAASKTPRQPTEHTEEDKKRISNYVNGLKGARKDNQAFDRIVAGLKDDKSIKVSHMRDVAQGFLGYSLAASKGRAQALQAIATMQALNQRQDARGSLIDRLHEW